MRRDGLLDGLWMGSVPDAVFLVDVWRFSVTGDG